MSTLDADTSSAAAEVPTLRCKVHRAARLSDVLKLKARGLKSFGSYAHELSLGCTPCHFEYKGHVRRTASRCRFGFNCLHCHDVPHQRRRNRPQVTPPTSFPPPVARLDMSAVPGFVVGLPSHSDADVGTASFNTGGARQDMSGVRVPTESQAEAWLGASDFADDWRHLFATSSASSSSSWQQQNAFLHNQSSQHAGRGITATFPVGLPPADPEPVIPGTSFPPPLGSLDMSAVPGFVVGLPSHSGVGTGSVCFNAGSARQDMSGVRGPTELQAEARLGASDFADDWRHLFATSSASSSSSWQQQSAFLHNQSSQHPGRGITATFPAGLPSADPEPVIPGTTFPPPLGSLDMSAVPGFGVGLPSHSGVGTGSFGFNAGSARQDMSGVRGPTELPAEARFCAPDFANDWRRVFPTSSASASSGGQQHSVFPHNQSSQHAGKGVTATFPSRLLSAGPEPVAPSSSGRHVYFQDSAYHGVAYPETGICTGPLASGQLGRFATVSETVGGEFIRGAVGGAHSGSAGPGPSEGIQGTSADGAWDAFPAEFIHVFRV